MIIRSAFGPRLDFSPGLNRLRARGRWRWLPIVLAILLLPGILLGQFTPGSAASQPSVSTSTLPPPVVPAPLANSSVSAPVGYILTPNDQVAVEVFGEDDLRTNGRLNGEGNLSVPLLGSIHLAGLTLTQAASKLTDLYGRDYLVNPRVNVMLLSYGKRRRFSRRAGRYHHRRGKHFLTEKFLRLRLFERTSWCMLPADNLP